MKTKFFLSFLICFSLIFQSSVGLGEDKPNQFLQELLKLKNETQKDNALIYYVKAGETNLPRPANSILRQCIQEGWTPKSKPLIPLFKLYKPAFTLVRKGAALDFAITPEQKKGLEGLSTPVPNFLQVQTLSKMLCAEGRYYESKKSTFRALDNYLLSVKMGRDFACPNSTLISGLVSNAVLNISYNCIADIFQSGKLKQNQLDRIAKTIESVEAKTKTFSDYLKDEHQGFNQIVEDQIKSGSDPFNDLERYNIKKEDIPKLLEEIKTFQLRIEDHKRLDYWIRNPLVWERITIDLEKSSNPLKIGFPNWYSAEVRFLSAKTKGKILLTMVAIEKYKMGKGKYPKRLQFLSEEYQSKNIIDPFSGEGLVYRPDPRGTYILYSLGPDRKDSGGKLKFELKKGANSPGDIYF